MDGTLQMSSDLENAEINTNTQLYYSTMSEQTNQLHTHTHKINSKSMNRKLVNNQNLYMKLAFIKHFSNN